MTSKIIGGYYANRGSATYMAFLRNKNDAIKCGASLISREHVLTAAHCLHPISGLKDQNFNNSVVVVGTIEIYRGGTSYEIEELFINEEYDHIKKSVSIGDIGIILVR